MPIDVEDVLRDLLAAIPDSPRLQWSKEALSRGAALHGHRRTAQVSVALVSLAAVVVTFGVAGRLFLHAAEDHPSADQGADRSGSSLTLSGIRFERLPTGFAPSGPDETLIRSEGAVAQLAIAGPSGDATLQVFRGPGWSARTVSHYGDHAGDDSTTTEVPPAHGAPGFVITTSAAGTIREVTGYRRLSASTYVVVSSNDLGKVTVRDLLSRIVVAS
jgi:hypothetical protein